MKWYEIAGNVVIATILSLTVWPLTSFLILIISYVQPYVLVSIIITWIIWFIAGLFITKKMSERFG
jgi:hypothetical protein